MQFNVGEAPVVSSEFCKDQSYGNIFQFTHPVMLHKKVNILNSCVDCRFT